MTRWHELLRASPSLDERMADPEVLQVVLDPGLASRFRMEIVRRFGGKKGDLSKAAAEALQMWIESDPAQKVAAVAKNRKLAYSVRRKALETLGKMGMAAFDCLAGIANDSAMEWSFQREAGGYLDSLVETRKREQGLSEAETFLLRHASDSSK